MDGETQGVAANQSFDGIQVGQLTGNEVFGDRVIYMSMVGNSTVGGIVLADEDIFSHDLRTGAWNVFFDGSDVGIATDVDAFHIQDDGSVLMSFNTTTAVAGVGNVDSRDIVRFIPTSTGEQTAGSFETYFDGSDVGLTTSSEGIDAIGFTPEGTLLISTSGAYSVNGVSGTDTDLLAFTASQLGADTAGSWELYVDGSDVELTSSAEDITGTWVDPDSGVIHFTTLGNVSSGGVSGTRNDILTCTAQTLGANTACDMAFFYSGGDNGITQGLDGIHLAKPIDENASDVTVSISDVAGPITVGDELTYQLTITNHGPAVATNVVLTNVLPAGTTLVSASLPCDNESGTLTCDLGDLAVGTVIQLDLVVGTTLTGELTNTATVSAESPDPNSSNNSASQTTSVIVSQADLAVTISDTADPRNVGESVTYNLTVTNQGPEAAANVVLENALPPNVTFTSASLSCAESSGVVTCDLGDLANGEQSNVVIEVVAIEPGLLSNTATVSSDTTDVTTANNDTEETTLINPPFADLSVTFGDADAAVMVGENVTYSIVVSNDGAEAATNVTLTHRLPASTVFVSSTDSCTLGSGVATCVLGDLASGQTAEIVLVVATTAAGQISGLATVTSDTADPNSSNNSATPVDDGVGTVRVHGHRLRQFYEQRQRRRYPLCRRRYPCPRYEHRTMVAVLRRFQGDSRRQRSRRLSYPSRRQHPAQL